ncbi:hypothetical protein [Enterococcus sp. LJL51]|uniref:hypothetical protein n=1 Tax=Enterococcus sp. LJL51 TaxID=3416656 RepID=UPI003CEC8759
MDRQNDIEGNNACHFYEGFQEYIQQKYNINSSHNWSDIIIFYCTTEEQAFDKFYELLDDFLI